MSRSARGPLAGCAAMLLLAGSGLTALVLLARLGPEPSPPSPVPSPAPQPEPEAFRTSVPAWRRFQSVEEPDGFQLSYGFVDHHGRYLQVACRVEREALERQRAAFGVDADALWREVNDELSRLVRSEIRSRRLEPYFRIRFRGRAGYTWEWKVPGDVPEPEFSRAVQASRRLAAWIEGELDARTEALKAEAYARRGLRVEDGKLRIDYTRIVDAGTAPLGDCFEALRRSGVRDDPRRLLGLYLAFFQELAYELPPEEEDGRRIYGLWVPPDVLVRGKGDCDSKSAAFASMWRRFPSRVLFILVPRHALVAVEATPRPGEHFVRLGNRYFLLCEVAGPAKLHPGRKPLEGSFEYVMIEPFLEAAPPAG